MLFTPFTNDDQMEILAFLSKKCLRHGTCPGTWTSYSYYYYYYWLD